VAVGRTGFLVADRKTQSVEGVMNLYRNVWLAVIGAVIFVAGLAVFGAYRALDLTHDAFDGKAVVLESDATVTADAHAFSFSTSSSYGTAFLVLAGVLAAMVVIYVIAGLTSRRRLAREERLAPVEPLRAAEDEGARRKAA
jgi:hypothetical protein